MLNSTIKILEKYIDNVKVFNIRSVEVFRVDIEDIIYIVRTENGDYEIYETDYVISFDEIIETLKEIAQENSFKFDGILNLKDNTNEGVIYTSDNQRYKYIVAKIIDAHLA